MSAGPLVVSVHALDTGGGEGFVSDAATVAELDCRAACVATSVLVPEPLPLDVLARQLDAVLAAGQVGAIRIGFLRGAAQVELLAHAVRRAAPAPAVLAVPLRAGTAARLDAETQQAMVRHLFPAARVVVARAVELEALAGRKFDDLEPLREAASKLREEGAAAVVIAGLSSRGRVLDLVDDGGTVVLLDTPRIHAARIPGLAGTYPAALAAHLARGLTLRDAADAAQRYIGFRLQRGR